METGKDGETKNAGFASYFLPFCWYKRRTSAGVTAQVGAASVFPRR